MNRLTKTRARAILTEELACAGWDTASTFTVEDGARPQADDLAWWHENTPSNERSDTLRNLAYLRAYVRIAEPLAGRMYACGLLLDRRRLWMDRSIMSRLERDGLVCWQGDGTKEPWFALTESGQRAVTEGFPDT